MTIDSSSLLGDPGAYAVSTHRAWIGRKEANLRRRLLDCGCPTTGEVFFHLWCDRLACREHADAAHDCEQFKGKDGIEEEAVTPEPGPPLTLDDVASAAVELRRRSPEDRRTYLAEQRARHVAMGAPEVWLEAFDAQAAALEDVTVAPEDLPGLRRAIERRRLTLADMEEASAAVRARRAEAEPQPVRHGFSTTHWAGVVGWRTICACQQGFDEESWHEHAHEHGVDPHGRHRDGAPCPCLTVCEHTSRDAPPVDELVEPDPGPRCSCGAAWIGWCGNPSGHPVEAAREPDALRHPVSAEEIQELWERLGAEDEQPVAAAPWWRRMLGGGTR